MLWTASLHPPEEGLTSRYTPRSPRMPTGCHVGALVPPLAGLAPASHRELQDASPPVLFTLVITWGVPSNRLGGVLTDAYPTLARSP
jgi:hypothetical protein